MCQDKCSLLGQIGKTAPACRSSLVNLQVTICEPFPVLYLTPSSHSVCTTEQDKRSWNRYIYPLEAKNVGGMIIVLYRTGQNHNKMCLCD